MGSYAIDGSGLTANNGNYSFVQAAGNATALTVNPAHLTYTADAAARLYGSDNPGFSGGVSGFVLGQLLADVTGGAASFTSPATSAPFPAGQHRQIAVKVIDPRGNELLVVKKLEETK